MKPSHDVKNINVGSYRFNGYKLKRDLDKNIVDDSTKPPQPDTWRGRAISPPDNYTQYPYTEK
jgi:hypothetical protein